MASISCPATSLGAAMSGPQTEGQWNQGGKLENLWDTWSIQGSGFVLLTALALCRQ